MHSSKRGFGQAVVIGGSIAGLLSARVLSEHFEKVIILERDVLPTGPEARKSAPQARHVFHVKHRSPTAAFARRPPSGEREKYVAVKRRMTRSLPRRRSRAPGPPREARIRRNRA